MTQPGDLRLAVGMVGGGPGSNIGIAHRTGLLLDDRYRLVAGSFARDPERSAAMVAQLGIDADRSYADYRDMAAAEAARPDGIDLVVVATPERQPRRDRHGLPRGRHRRRLREAAGHRLGRRRRTGGARSRTRPGAGRRPLLLGLRHGAPRRAAGAGRGARRAALRRRRARQRVGVHAAWRPAGHKQAAWRMDPDVAGYASVVADIGIHAFHLRALHHRAGGRGGLRPARHPRPGRRVADNATVALRLTGGVPGRLWASMAATGQAHGLKIRVFGERRQPRVVARGPAAPGGAQGRRRRRCATPRAWQGSARTRPA